MYNSNDITQTHLVQYMPTTPGKCDLVAMTQTGGLHQVATQVPHVDGQVDPHIIAKWSHMLVEVKYRVHPLVTHVRPCARGNRTRIKRATKRGA